MDYYFEIVTIELYILYVFNIVRMRFESQAQRINELRPKKPNTMNL